MKSSALLVFFLLFSILNLKADAQMTLTQKDRSIVSISACTARGDMVNLKAALTAGLDAGLTVNEIKEVLTQLYAYCGFPRSLNALSEFMSLIRERETRGVHDTPGALPSPLPRGNVLELGTENQTRLCGMRVKGSVFEFAPAIDEYLKAHLFGDIFSRDNLDWKTREIATIAALAAMRGTESQLAAHIGIGKHNGVTDAQVSEILETVQSSAVSDFPRGGENTAYAKYFSGKCYLAQLTKDTELNVPVANVTFEPGCRNNWHSHTGGQLLIAVGGVGYYQERGKAARKLLPGDIVEIPPNTVHWHGAAPTSWFSHLAVECNPTTNRNTWMEPVSDADYQRATSGEQPGR